MIKLDLNYNEENLLAKAAAELPIGTYAPLIEKIFSALPKVYCERCGEELRRDRVVSLELSNTTNLYHLDGIPEGEVSQGWFDFGASCAKAVIKESSQAVFIIWSTFLNNTGYNISLAFSCFMRSSL